MGLGQHTAEVKKREEDGAKWWSGELICEPTQQDGGALGRRTSQATYSAAQRLSAGTAGPQPPHIKDDDAVKALHGLSDKFLCTKFEPPVPLPAVLASQ